MQARKKSGVITVQQYQKSATQAWPSFVAFKLGDPVKVWNEPQQSWINVNEGDYVRIDNPRDVYPIAADYFAENYDPVEEA